MSYYIMYFFVYSNIKHICIQHESIKKQNINYLLLNYNQKNVKFQMENTKSGKI